MNELTADDSDKSIPDLAFSNSIELLHQRWQDILSGDVYPQLEPTNTDTGLFRSIDNVIDDIAILVQQQNNELTYFQAYSNPN